MQNVTALTILAGEPLYGSTHIYLLLDMDTDGNHKLILKQSCAGTLESVRNSLRGPLRSLRMKPLTVHTPSNILSAKCGTLCKLGRAVRVFLFSPQGHRQEIGNGRTL
jgi:hypothetical protein